MSLDQLSLGKKYIEESAFATSIPGVIKNAEGKINNKITYARITIRRLANEN